MVFLHLKMFLTPRIYTSVRVFFIFPLRSIYLCVSWQKWWFLHLKTLYTWRIYTSVQVFFNFFYWRIPLCKLTIMVFPSLEYVFYPNNIHLCTSRLKWCFLHLKKKYTPLSEMTKMIFPTLKNVFNLKNIHLCTSVFQFFNEEYL